MEVVRGRRQSAAVPLTVVLAAFAALVLGISGWYAAHNPASVTTSTRYMAAGASSLGPDAQERNDAILAAQLAKGEATHGH